MVNKINPVITTVKNSDGTSTKTTTTTTTEKNADGSTTIKITMNIAQDPSCVQNSGAAKNASVPPKKNPLNKSTSGLVGHKSATKVPSNANGGKAASPVGGAPLSGGLTEAEAAKLMKKAPRIKNTTDRNFMEDVVNTHNRLRAKHGIPALSMDEDLNQVAQAYANKLAEDSSLDPSSNGFGENTLWSNKVKSGREVTEAWYAEIEDYNFKNIGPQENTAHMAQVLWKSSMKLGIAMAKGDDGYYVVANYNKPGNHLGRFQENIFAPKK